eukprot:TRINITY_DN19779_c0_g1_i1.p2 TRINITY_DN19779_c0_g1~~TRINITY_DN19779_c0_g1_i1.p2  ORF type:complete len:136 (+),score=78.72 TRINITY_DN19779_c0_g1_i1:54-410(+)
MAEVFYEVNLSVNPEIDEAYGAALEPHVQAMLQFDGFKDAVITKRRLVDEAPDKEDDGKLLYTVLYTVASRECLQGYFDNHAAEMRKEMMDLFGPKDGVPQFTASRRIHEVKKRFAKA